MLVYTKISVTLKTTLSSETPHLLTWREFGWTERSEEYLCIVRVVFFVRV